MRAEIMNFDSNFLFCFFKNKRYTIMNDEVRNLKELSERKCTNESFILYYILLFININLLYL